MEPAARPTGTRAVPHRRPDLSPDRASVTGPGRGARQTLTAADRSRQRRRPADYRRHRRRGVADDGGPSFHRGVSEAASGAEPLPGSASARREEDRHRTRARSLIRMRRVDGAGRRLLYNSRVASNRRVGIVSRAQTAGGERKPAGARCRGSAQFHRGGLSTRTSTG